MNIPSLSSLPATAGTLYWRSALYAGLALTPQLVFAQNQQPGPQQPQRADDLSQLLGDQGTVRGTGRLILDFGLWAATLIGVGMVIYGLYNGIQQASSIEPQRRYGKAIMYTIGGAALSGIKFIWEWIAQSVTGAAPASDVFLP